MTAVQHGAVVANYTEVTELHKKADPSRNGQERIYAATVKDNLTGKTMKVRCRVCQFRHFTGHTHHLIGCHQRDWTFQ